MMHSCVTGLIDINGKAIIERLLQGKDRRVPFSVSPRHTRTYMHTARTTHIYTHDHMRTTLVAHQRMIV